MIRAIPVILSIGLTIFALADCIQTEDDKVRGIPKWAWIVLIVLIPWVGALTWMFIGKDRFGGGRGGAGGPRRQGPLAPDEDPDFLRKLDEDIRRERREQQRRDRSTGEDDEDPGPGGSDEDLTGR